MASIDSIYTKRGKELGIKVRKTHFIPIDHIFIEEGFNIRDLDDDHINAIAEGYRDGDEIPAIVVKPVGERFQVVDGAHRFSAAIIAGVERLECKSFAGNASDEVSLMITSSQGRNLLPLERAKAYDRLKKLGHTPDEIAAIVKRSRVDVDSHLILITAPDDVQTAVKNKEISYTTVVSEIRKNGTEGEAKLSKAVQAAKTAPKVEGKKTPKVKLPTFTKKDHADVMEILTSSEVSEWEAKLTPFIDKYVKVQG